MKSILSIKANLLVGPGLRKKVLRNLKNSQNWETFLLSSNFELNFLSFLTNTRIFVTSQKILLDHRFVEINAKKCENLNFRAKTIFISKTAPSSGYDCYQNVF